MTNLNIIIAGVGGQGTLLASRVLGKYATNKNFDCKLSEVHGMSQRGGSVITFVRIGENINSPIIDFGCADVLLAFEKLEALRYTPYLKKEGVTLYSSQEIMPMPVVTGAKEYPSNIEDELINGCAINALELAVKAGNVKSANSVMIGALTKKFNIDKEEMLSALVGCIPEKLIEVNKIAYELGYDAV